MPLTNREQNRSLMETLSRNVKGISVQESEDMIALCAKFTEDTIRHGSYEISVYGGRVVSISSTRSIGVKVVDPDKVVHQQGSRLASITESIPLVHPNKGISKANNVALLEMCRRLTDSRVMFGSYEIDVSGGKVSSIGFSRSVKIEIVENDAKPTAPAMGDTKAGETPEGAK